MSDKPRRPFILRQKVAIWHPPAVLHTGRIGFVPDLPGKSIHPELAKLQLIHIDTEEGVKCAAPWQVYRKDETDRLVAAMEDYISQIRTLQNYLKQTELEVE